MFIRASSDVVRRTLLLNMYANVASYMRVMGDMSSNAADVDMFDDSRQRRLMDSKFAIVGVFLHSRVARSQLQAAERR